MDWQQYEAWSRAWEGPESERHMHTGPSDEPTGHLNPPPDRQNFRPIKPPYPPIPGDSPMETMERLYAESMKAVKECHDLNMDVHHLIEDIHEHGIKNGAYYGKDVIRVEEGYSAEDSAPYKLVFIRHHDHYGKPVKVDLHLAYGNTTNSGVKENTFDASLYELAQVMMPAMQGYEKWKENVTLDRMPIPAEANADGYTYGFSEHGTLKVYKNSYLAENEDALRRDGVTTSMGCEALVLRAGEKDEESFSRNINSSGKSSRVILGQVAGTKDIIILACGGWGDAYPGMELENCVNILKGYHVLTAVQVCSGDDACCLYEGDLLFPVKDGVIPKNTSFLYVSKKSSFKNELQFSLAYITQLMNQMKERLKLTDKEILALMDDLEQEKGDRENAVQDLQGKLDAETAERQKEDKKLQDELDNHESRLKSVEGWREWNDSAIQDLHDKVDAWGKHDAAEFADVRAALDAEKQERQKNDREHEQALTDLKMQDEFLKNEIKNEADLRRAEDDNIRTYIGNVDRRYREEDKRLDQRIDDTNNQLSSEIERSTQKDKEHAAKLTELTMETESLEQALNKETQDRLTEQSNFNDALNNFRTSLEAEKTARTEADKDHERTLTELKMADTAIQNEFRAADGELETKLQNEIDLRTTTDQQFASEMATWEERLNAKDQTLTDHIAECDAKHQALEEAQKTLSQNLNLEIAQRQAMYNAIDRKVNAETENRLAGDTELSDRIDQLNLVQQGMQSDMTTLTSTVNNFKEQLSSATQTGTEAAEQATQAAEQAQQAASDAALAQADAQDAKEQAEAAKQAADTAQSALEAAQEAMTKAQADAEQAKTDAADAKAAVEELQGSLDSYATDADLESYLTKTEAEASYQPKGDYVTTDQLEGYEPVGDYLTKTEATATYQPKGEYLTSADLEPYATTASLSEYLTSEDAASTYQPIGEYATKTELNGYQPKGDYVTTESLGTALEGYQAAGDYLTAESLPQQLTDYAKKSEIPTDYVTDESLTETLSEYAKTTELPAAPDLTPYLTKADATATYQPKGEYLTADALEPYATTESLSGYQPKGDYATKTELAGYQPKGDYLTAATLPDELTDYAKKSEIPAAPDLTSYLTKTDAAAAYQAKGDYATTAALNAKLNLAGGTMTGPLVLSGAPTEDLHAATKAYVDSKAGGASLFYENLAPAPVTFSVSGLSNNIYEAGITLGRISENVSNAIFIVSIQLVISSITSTPFSGCIIINRFASSGGVLTCVRAKGVENYYLAVYTSEIKGDNNSFDIYYGHPMSLDIDSTVNVKPISAGTADIQAVVIGLK